MYQRGTWRPWYIVIPSSTEIIDNSVNQPKKFSGIKKVTADLLYLKVLEASETQSYYDKINLKCALIDTPLTVISPIMGLKDMNVIRDYFTEILQHSYQS